MMRDESNDYSLSGNQFYNASVQLDAGIRLLQGQGFYVNDTIRLCHTSCDLLDGGPLSDYLAQVSTFLEENPYEVVTLLWVNIDGVSLEEWATAYAAANLTSMSFVPNMDYDNITLESWPTISELVAKNKRLVTFLQSGANETEIPWLLDEFTYMFETSYNNNSPSDFDCTVDRPANSTSTGKLQLINHFLYASFLGIQYPNVSYVDTTNGVGPGAGNLLTHATTCNETFGRAPNFMLVDFFDRGAVFEVQDAMNAIPSGTADDGDMISRVVPAAISATATAVNAGGTATSTSSVGALSGLDSLLSSDARRLGSAVWSVVAAGVVGVVVAL
ncbi:hypothetical protein RUND412_004704 [Rhizina undulata]